MRFLPFEIKPFWAAGAAALATTGCAPDSLPEDLNGLVHFAWDALDEGSTEELATAFLGLDQSVGADSLDRVFEGALTELTAEQASGNAREQVQGLDRHTASQRDCGSPDMRL